jgi:adenylate kinase family enzyme
MIGIVLLGPPGVGKGTQAVRLKEAMRLFHLSTGDALRQAVRSGTPLGARVKAVIESGALVSVRSRVGEVQVAAEVSGREWIPPGWLSQNRAPGRDPRYHARQALA